MALYTAKIAITVHHITQKTVLILLWFANAKDATNALTVENYTTASTAKIPTTQTILFIVSTVRDVVTASAVLVYATKSFISLIRNFRKKNMKKENLNWICVIQKFAKSYLLNLGYFRCRYLTGL